jgi:Fe-S-cluster-containing hydrogenase component 2
VGSHLKFPAGSILFKEGKKGDVLHFIRRGSVSVSRSIRGREHLLSYRQAGNYIGEMAILSGGPRTATVRACPDTETICLNADVVNRLMSKHPELRVKLEKRFQKNLAEDIVMEKRHDAGGIMPLFTEQGVGEATDVLLIDESLCIHCDNCEKACAGTHFGVSRLRRQGGTNYASIRVPTSCRHCESPHCMKDCPPDAIHRAVDGEVFITDNCIGCGNCESNCPYGVIQIATLRQPTSRHVFFNLLFGFGGKASHESDPTQTAKVAVKCDMCVNLPGGPACVRSCPAGAATRVSPKELINIAQVSDY